MIKTIIIDSKKEDRDRVKSCLSVQNEIEILACGEDGYDALKLTGCLKPDIAIMNNGLDLIGCEDIPPLLRLRSPGTAVVILFAKISDRQLQRAVLNRVSGFVSRETEMEQLPGILKCISAGGCYISPPFAARILQILSAEKTAGKPREFAREDPVDVLSKTELQILSRVGKGLASDEIARELNLAVGTVRNSISTVMRKTGLRNRSQMACYAVKNGLVLPVLPYNKEKTTIA